MPVKTVEIITEKLVPIHVPGDSALLQALFWCDSLNQVQMLRYEELKSNNINTSLLFQNGLLTYQVVRAPSEMMIPYKTIEKSTEVPIEVEVPIIEYKLNWFQKIFYWLGVATSIYALVRLTIFVTTKTVLKR